ncbi:hypothetical protein EJ06DRAFT_583716 [Trichodelitschia bisporula]|uniref:Myb-like domain-containing protein n=1 Tax=Trichodelitschia bisporula TaxID=703511 RepID=A0A6G1HR31_9PEZI|nr:hypothetical protein EJ06DRAFT_583716 [Trichodelitschia bisporula]
MARVSSQPPPRARVTRSASRTARSPTTERTTEPTETATTTRYTRRHTRTASAELTTRTTTRAQQAAALSAVPEAVNEVEDVEVEEDVEMEEEMEEEEEEAENPSSPVRSIEAPNHSSPDVASINSDDSAISTFSEGLTSELDVEFILADLRDLYHASISLLELLTHPEHEGTLKETIKQFKQPGTKRAKLLNTRSFVFDEHFKHLSSELFVKVSTVDKAAQRQMPANLLTAEKLYLEPIFLANLARLSRWLALSEREAPETYDQIRSLDNEFPAPFLNGFQPAPETGPLPVGASHLRRDSFDVALHIRTQLCILRHLAESINPRPRLAEKAIQDCFYAESTDGDGDLNLRGWDVTAFEAGPQGLLPEFKRLVLKRIDELREYFAEMREDLFAEPPEQFAHLAWNNFATTVIEWTYQRSEEICVQLHMHGSIIDAVRSITDPDYFHFRAGAEEAEEESEAESEEESEDEQVGRNGPQPLPDVDDDMVLQEHIRQETAEQLEDSAEETAPRPRQDARPDDQPLPDIGEQAPDEREATADAPIGSQPSAPTGSYNWLVGAMRKKERREKENLLRTSGRFVDSQPGAKTVSWDDTQKTPPQPSQRKRKRRPRRTTAESESPASHASGSHSEDSESEGDSDAEFETNEDAAEQARQRLAAENERRRKRPRTETADAESSSEDEVPTASARSPRRRLLELQAQAPRVPSRVPSGPRRAWSTDETEALLEYMHDHGTRWAEIKSADSRGKGLLAGRDQIALKDKARNLKFMFLKHGDEVPEALEGLTLAAQQVRRLHDLNIEYEN